MKERFEFMQGEYTFPPANSRTYADWLDEHHFMAVPVGAHKRPIVKKWPELTPEEARKALYETQGTKGAAVLCDCKHGNGLLVIDLDCKNGVNGYASFAQHLATALPPTMLVKTPSGGLHIYYRLSNEQKGKFRSRAGWLNGVDVRAHNAIAVAPYTLYPMPFSPYFGIPYLPSAGQEIAPLPDALAKMLPRIYQNQEQGSGAFETSMKGPAVWSYSCSYDPNRERWYQRLLENGANDMVPGKRNDTLYLLSLKAFSHRNSIPEERIRSDLMRIALNAGLSAYEAKTTIMSGYRNSHVKF